MVRFDRAEARFEGERAAIDLDGLSGQVDVLVAKSLEFPSMAIDLLAGPIAFGFEPRHDLDGERLGRRFALARRPLAKIVELGADGREPGFERGNFPSPFIQPRAGPLDALIQAGNLPLERFKPALDAADPVGDPSEFRPEIGDLGRQFPAHDASRLDRFGPSDEGSPAGSRAATNGWLHRQQVTVRPRYLGRTFTC